MSYSVTFLTVKILRVRRSAYQSQYAQVCRIPDNLYQQANGHGAESTHRYNQGTNQQSNAYSTVCVHDLGGVVC